MHDVRAISLLQEGLWQRLAAFTDKLLRSCTAVWHLHRVLAKKRDPLTHVLFLDNLSVEGGAPLSLFWYNPLPFYAISYALETKTRHGRPPVGLVKETGSCGICFFPVKWK